MKIKFLKASSYYTDYLRQFYAKRPNLTEAPYKKNYDAIIGDCFASSDSWTRNLTKIGPFEGQEIVTNAEPMQKAWAREHGLKFSEENWKLDILEAQIDQFEPDVFFAHDLVNITPEFRFRLKQKYPKLKIIAWDGVAKNDEKLLAGCDMVLSSLESVADYYHSKGFKTLYMLSGFDASILNKIEKRQPTINCSFVGSILGGEDRHNERLRLVSHLSRKTNLSPFIPHLPDYKHLGKEFVKNILGSDKRVFGFEEILDLLELKIKNGTAAYGIQMYQLLADSKITFNSHIGAAGNKAANMRLLEATGTGTLLLTDFKENLNDLFQMDKEVVAYKTKEEAVEKIKYYLEHEKERAAIAAAGQARTLRDYNFEKTMSKFSDFLSTL